MPTGFLAPILGGLALSAGNNIFGGSSLGSLANQNQSTLNPFLLNQIQNQIGNLSNVAGLNANAAFQRQANTAADLGVQNANFTTANEFNAAQAAALAPAQTQIQDLLSLLGLENQASQANAQQQAQLAQLQQQAAQLQAQQNPQSQTGTGQQNQPLNNPPPDFSQPGGPSDSGQGSTQTTTGIGTPLQGSNLPSGIGGSLIGTGGIPGSGK